MSYKVNNTSLVYTEVRKRQLQDGGIFAKVEFVGIVSNIVYKLVTFGLGVVLVVGCRVPFVLL